MKYFLRIPGASIRGVAAMFESLLLGCEAKSILHRIKGESLIW